MPSGVDRARSLVLDPSCEHEVVIELDSVTPIDPDCMEQPLWAIPSDPVDAQDAIHQDRHAIHREHFDLPEVWAGGKN